MEAITEYTPPEILNDMDEETIHDRMLDVIPDNIDKTEGGFAYDFTMPAAIEKASAMEVLNQVIQLFFPEWSAGEFLDKLGANVGLTRKAATVAEATVQITGTAGTLIEAGFLFSTAATAISENVEFETLEDVVLDENGEGEVAVRCTQAGMIGNVSAQSITLMVDPLEDIESVTNALAATGGTDEEDDDVFRQRIMDRERDNDSSFVGCDADYKRWALEINGVGTAIVVPEWDGPGTVKLIVMDSNGAPATATIIANVYNHIISPEDRQERLAPIGATLTVVTASVMALTITASIMKEPDIEVEDITAAFKTNLATCFEEAMADGVLRWTKVGAALSKTKGIIDYENLLINGSADNIEVSLDEYPVAQTVTLTVEASIT